MRVIYSVLFKILACISMMYLIKALFGLQNGFILLYIVNLFFMAVMVLFNWLILRGRFYIPVLLGVLLPGPGTIIASFFDVFQIKGKNFRWRIEEYKKYLDTLLDLGMTSSAQKLNVEKETNILSPIDELQYSDQRRKKELIFNLVNQPQDDRVGKILKTALYDSDTEIKHFAAAMIVSIEDNFERRIVKLKTELKENEKLENLLLLISEYERYLDSNILDEFSRKLVLNEMLNTLSIAKNHKAEEKEILLKMFRINIELEEFGESLKLAEQIQSLYGEDKDTLFLSMKLYFELKNYSKVREFSEKLSGISIQLEGKQKEIMQFWNSNL